MPSLRARGAALAAACAFALLGEGCHSGSSHNPVEQRLERADLVLAAKALQAVAPVVEQEARATKSAWPHIYNGLTGDGTGRPLIGEAARRAEALPLPALFGEERAGGLTGPASSIAGTFANFNHLAARGWRTVDYDAEQIQQGSPAAAAFARASVALYIDSVYDAHFALSQIGKKLAAGYEALGGEAEFGSALTPAEVQRLADTYSEANFRLEPHVGVHLGS